ncbi:pimeloyl-ACP methyl ester carboxylesterase [Evansella vedderi]|uniref:Pimeloyl-ACP methyl ester carboxylesterase n=1 Tax=Evansella vedderi TaxID=38282 RepID=A0ABT9ZU09_9BACI|nr:alpha/beta hydrolase [Evansella vedderi]MDQ0254733.1 pimeloyl-ACP methyl ester carboxylesterase [Evansella vedderi]
MSLPSLLHHQIYHNKKLGESAPWVVLLHGIGGNSNIWYKQLKKFKRHFNVLAIDLPGHYPNDTLQAWEEEYSFEKCADMIVQVLDEYRIHKAHFIGISLGSVLIHQLVKRHQDRVYSAVLGGMILRFNLLSKVLLFLGHGLKKFLPYMWLYKLFAHIMMPKNNHKQAREMFINEAKKMCRNEFLKWFKLTRDVQATSKNIEAYDVPRLYISGNEDHLFIKVLKKYLPNDRHGQLVELNDCGHVCNLEKSDEFNYHAITFIEQFSERKGA